MSQQATCRHNIIEIPKIVPMEIASVRSKSTLCLHAVPGMKL